MIPGFTDFELIGEGGFATVHRARDTKLGRDVAIKILRPAPDSADRLRRFGREANAMAELGWHPNIAVIHDSGTTDDGRAYLVMEYLAHGSLADRLASHGPIPEPEVAQIARQLADALDAVHGAGLIHRDIKPSNVLVGRRGEPKLGDFGIASTTNGQTTGLFAATVLHAAPEILLTGSATTASDLYSLGSTLHTLLTGTPPFHLADRDDPASLLDRMLTTASPDLTRHGVSTRLTRIIEQCLDMDPSARPASAAALRRLLDTEPVRPPPPHRPDADTPTGLLAPTGVIEPADPTGPAAHPGSGPPSTVVIAETPGPPPRTPTAPIAGPARPLPPRDARRRSPSVLILAAGLVAIFIGALVVAARWDRTSDDNPDERAASSTTSTVGPEAAGFVGHQGAYFQAAVPEGWERTLADDDRGYGFRSRWQNGEGHFVVIDVSLGQADGDHEGAARSIAATLGSRVTRDVAAEDIPGRREAFSFEFVGRGGDDRIDIFFPSGQHGFAVLAGGSLGTESEEILRIARTVAGSVQAGDGGT